MCICIRIRFAAAHLNHHDEVNSSSSYVCVSRRWNQKAERASAAIAIRAHGLHRSRQTERGVVGIVVVCVFAPSTSLILIIIRLSPLGKSRNQKIHELCTLSLPPTHMHIYCKMCHTPRQIKLDVIIINRAALISPRTLLLFAYVSNRVN
jgi:hypothetical protein